MTTEQTRTMQAIAPQVVTLQPETANQLTHAFGCLLSLYGAGLIISSAWATGGTLRILGCSVYAISLVGVYAASTLSHSFSDVRRRTFFRMLDQICILLLVVGTYTPFALVYALSGAWWLILATMWTCAVIGIWLRIRRPSDSLPIPLFMVMGWLPIMALGMAWDLTSVSGIGLILAGGLAYSGGTWFLANDDRHPYYHAVWHVCAITGSALHFAFLLLYVAVPAV